MNNTPTPNPEDINWNLARIEKGRKMLRAHAVPGEPEISQTALEDALANLMHAAFIHVLDFQSGLKQAHIHFVAEVEAEGDE